jgi:transposase
VARLRDWQEAGVWHAFHRALLDRLGGAGLIDWSRCSLDAASLPAKAGGTATGPNPTDRGKPGSKRHVLVDTGGIPLAFLLTARTCTTAPRWSRCSTPCRRSANAPVGQAARRQRLRLSPLPPRLRQRRIVPRIARRGAESGERLGRHR